MEPFCVCPVLYVSGEAMKWTVLLICVVALVAGVAEVGAYSSEDYSNDIDDYSGSRHVLKFGKLKMD
ncbi:hypothetical protein OESDEN_09359 [Oesophagostomum dentatum]|uniref:Uncharacterized protein n=1 Tax=Oesophagostomum dentatum TaxID=61180 RepID=A0A0B1T4R9_OESDE|nr:hypothetical protein OESDEN_09359 [Oesophagostomum dentatum]